MKEKLETGNLRRYKRELAANITAGWLSRMSEKHGVDCLIDGAIGIDELNIELLLDAKFTMEVILGSGFVIGRPESRIMFEVNLNYIYSTGGQFPPIPENDSDPYATSVGTITLDGKKLSSYCVYTTEAYSKFLEEAEKIIFDGKDHSIDEMKGILKSIEGIGSMRGWND